MSLDDHFATAIADVDAEFARPVELLFLASGRADPDRENITIQAILRADDVSLKGLSKGGMKASMQSGGGTLAINRHSYTGPPIKKNDKIRDLNHPDQPFFEVLTVDYQNRHRIIITLGNA